MAARDLIGHVKCLLSMLHIWDYHSLLNIESKMLLIKLSLNGCAYVAAIAHDAKCIDSEANAIEMARFATALSMLCCFEFFVCSQCQSFLNSAEISKTEQIIQDNMFYPPFDSQSVGDDRKPLVFGLIMSFGGNFDSSGAVPGVRVALDRINSDPALLPGYTLHYALSDSRVS